nr:MAG TPA: hypothetical protein [Caudoviricetes sp.]
MPKEIESPWVILFIFYKLLNLLITKNVLIRKGVLLWAY